MCNHENKIPTRRVVNGNQTASMQCQRCGSGFAVKKSLYNLNTLPEFDESIKERYWAAQKEESKKRYDELMATFGVKTGPWWDKYNAYLRSSHWHRIRDAVIARDQVCQVCFGRSAVQAHHVSYDSFKRFGISFSVECVGVCHACHEMLHKKDGGK